MFFYANSSVTVNDSTFWQHGFKLRHFKSHYEAADNCDTKDFEAIGFQVMKSPCKHQKDFVNAAACGSQSQNGYKEVLVCASFLQPIAKAILSAGKTLQLLQHVHYGVPDELSNSEFISIAPSFLPRGRSSHLTEPQKVFEFPEKSPEPTDNLSWFDRSMQLLNIQNETRWQSLLSVSSNNPSDLELPVNKGFGGGIELSGYGGLALADNIPQKTSDPEGCPNRECVGLVQSCLLPALNDGEIYRAVLASNVTPSDMNAIETPVSEASYEMTSDANHKTWGLTRGTDYGNGSGCGNLLIKHTKLDMLAMEQLFPSPTVLPSSEKRPVKHPTSGNRVAAVTRRWLQKEGLKVMSLPQILVQESFITCFQNRVEVIGKHVLSKLMGEWRLMEELSILRAVYLIGSGDLLQQFSSVLFNKLDRGEPWEDFYELNTMLQESVRSSADGMLLPALDSLVVNAQVGPNGGGEQGPSLVPLHLTGRNPTCGIDTLDSLFFVYKVSWPLELIIDTSTIKKYNQVMGFLFKVKRAKFALDKACRWMWKNGRGDHAHLKQQLLLQQQFMHFVNTLHQYIMDRVLYSAWMELCEGMASAHSLDEVIACHDAYLVSIQRQCLVAPDKLQMQSANAHKIEVANLCHEAVY